MKFTSFFFSLKLFESNKFITMDLKNEKEKIKKGAKNVY